MDGGTGIESAGESQADLFTHGQVLKNVSHLKYPEFDDRPRAAD
jgi:hypothetical protein